MALFLVHVGKEVIHKYVRYEVFLTVYVGMIANQREVPKSLPFKNYQSESKIVDVHILRTYGHIPKKY